MAGDYSLSSRGFTGESLKTALGGHIFAVCHAIALFGNAQEPHCEGSGSIRVFFSRLIFPQLCSGSHSEGSRAEPSLFGCISCC